MSDAAIGNDAGRRLIQVTWRRLHPLRRFVTAALVELAASRDACAHQKHCQRNILRAISAAKNFRRNALCWSFRRWPSARLVLRASDHARGHGSLESTIFKTPATHFAPPPATSPPTKLASPVRLENINGWLKLAIPGFTPQPQGSASRRCETGVDENSILGRLPAAGGHKSHPRAMMDASTL